MKEIEQIIENLMVNVIEEDPSKYHYKARRIAKMVLGKSLPPQAIIHHVDNNPTNNRPSNLVICENQAYHKLLHRRMDALRACGYVNWRRCKYCKEYDSPKNLYITPAGNICWHRKCHTQYNKEYRKVTLNTKVL